MAKKIIDNKKLDELYIPIYEASERRKSLLGSIKNSLILQEEGEKIKELRLSKKKLLTEIKSSLVLINQDYQNIKKLFPNVKSVISYTEKELNFLEDQVNVLKKEVKNVNLKEEEDTQLIKKLNDSPIEVPIISKKKNTIIKKKKEVKLSKLDRIKNNLSVIESKLNNL